MKNCENCNKENEGSYGSGRFCSSKCSRSFSTKSKRKEINEKVSKTLTGSGNDDLILICNNCQKEFSVKWKRRDQITCSPRCSAELKWKDDEYRKKVSTKSKERCSSMEEKKRLRDIGRKGGFGKKGMTKNGNRYESILEKKCFELLEELEIEFTPHKPIPNSSKISDVYIHKFGLWIEIDGINREKRKAWLGKDYEYWKEKIEIYERENLNFAVVTSFDSFKEKISPLA